MLNNVRWGIIGCGDVTEVKSGPGFQKAAKSSLIAVMRRNGALARDYAARHNVPKWYDDADRLIQDPEVDAVYVATPPAYHKEYALRAIKAGKPVYVEKPMATSYRDCLEMIKASEDAGVPLYVAYYRRGLERFQKVKELVEGGAIGEVRFATMELYRTPLNTAEEGLPWRVIPEIAGGGLFMDLASHTLDIFDYILGPVSRVAGHAANQAKLYQAEDIVTANLTFGQGVEAVGVWCFAAFEAKDVNEIVGSQGKLTFSTFGQEPILLTDSEGVKEFPILNPLHIQQPLIQSMVDELTGHGKCPSTGISAARTSWVMEELLRNYY